MRTGRNQSTTIADLLEEIGSRLQAEFVATGIPRSRIVEEAERLGYDRRSVLPSDYCYNLINTSPSSFRHPLFEQIEKGYFRFIGKGYPYSGSVWWMQRNGRKEEVGKWISGDCRLQSDPRRLRSSGPDTPAVGSTLGEASSAVPSKAIAASAGVSQSVMDWSRLSKLQIGRYSEYFVKMEFTLHGFDVYSSEVDDKGIDFVVRKHPDKYYDVQVKSARMLKSGNYIFMRKDKFQPCSNILAAIVLFFNECTPYVYLIPSQAWLTPDSLFCDRDYEGRKSKPEWGLNICKKNMRLLEPYSFTNMAATL